VQLGPTVSRTHIGDASVTTETRTSINGRTVPVEEVEERIIRDDASGKTVERIIHRFDDTGRPAGTRKVVIDEEKHAGGSSTVLATTYANDVNGHMSVIERATTENEVSGTTITSATLVERPTVNGSLELVEKQNVVTSKQTNGYEEASVTFRKDPTGQFYAAVRKVTEHTESGNRSSDNTAEYELGPTGQLELHSQQVKNTEKGSGGAENVQVDVFRKNVPGVVNTGRSLQLIEHQIVERRPTAGGVVETLSVQRPTVSDPRRLGPPQQVSETVCRGGCGKP
jgi:hypothetical protein